MQELQNTKRRCVQESRSLQEQVEYFTARRPYTKFVYRDPETNFNRKSVVGVVCRLIKLKNPETAAALETAAGGGVSLFDHYQFFV